MGEKGSRASEVWYCVLSSAYLRHKKTTAFEIPNAGEMLANVSLSPISSEQSGNHEWGINHRSKGKENTKHRELAQNQRRVGIIGRS